MKNYSDAGLPTLLVYQGSKLKMSFIRICDVLGAKPQDRQIVQFLADNGILKVPTGGLDKLKPSSKLKWDGDD